MFFCAKISNNGFVSDIIILLKSHLIEIFKHIKRTEKIIVLNELDWYY